MSELPRTITEASRLIEARELSPVELVRAALERIERIDPVISSFITVTAESALEQARAAEKEIANGRYRGALHGIPFGAKDNYETLESLGARLGTVRLRSVGEYCDVWTLTRTPFKSRRRPLR